MEANKNLKSIPIKFLSTAKLKISCFIVISNQSLNLYQQIGYIRKVSGDFDKIDLERQKHG